MKIKEMKRIAALAVPGEWRAEDRDIRAYYNAFNHRMALASTSDNAKFIALAANTYDKLLAVAEAAKACRTDICFGSIEYKLVENFDKALEALEAE